jgi:hypothetical protein
MDRQQASDAEFQTWMRSIGQTQRAEVSQSLKALEHDLPERQSIDYREGARLALLDVLGRMLTKESNAAQKAMSDKGDFEQWLREFYPRHEALMRDALPSACWSLRAAGVAKWGKPADLAAWLRARNVEALQRCYNSDTPETASRRLKAWPTDRAKELTALILGEDSSGVKEIRDLLS